MSGGGQQRGDLIHKYNEVNVIRLIIHRRLGFFLFSRVCGLLGGSRGYRAAVKETEECVEAFFFVAVGGMSIFKLLLFSLSFLLSFISGDFRMN